MGNDAEFDNLSARLKRPIDSRTAESYWLGRYLLSPTLLTY
jgi:hypothetical protein